MNECRVCGKSGSNAIKITLPSGLITWTNRFYIGKAGYICVNCHDGHNGAEEINRRGAEK